MTLRTDLSPSPGGRRWLRLSFLFMATGIATLLAAGALFVLNYVSDDERPGGRQQRRLLRPRRLVQHRAGGRAGGRRLLEAEGPGARRRHRSAPRGWHRV